VLWYFITVKRTETADFGLRLAEITAIARLIRYRRHSVKDLCNEDLGSCNVKPPKKNWSSSFFARKGQPQSLSKRPNLARKGSNDMTKLLKDLNPMIQRTKILHENTFRLLVVGGVLLKDSMLRELMTGDYIAEYMKRTRAGEVLTIVECVSLQHRALSPFIVWPATTAVISRTPARPSFDHGITSSKTGEFDNIAFSDWLERIFDHQTRNQTNGRPRFLIVDRLANYWSERIDKFCQSRKIVMCEAQGSLAKRLPPSTVPHTEACASVVGALQQAYNEKKSLGMDFWESYRDAHDGVFDRREGGTVDSGLVQMPIDPKIDTQPADAMLKDERVIPASASTIGRNVDSVPESQMMSSARFGFLASRVQHDLACIDMDEAARGRLNDLIRASKTFASVIHGGERHERA
jgi:hypothetical protein